ncbi:PQQ-dependent catabolism-associated CXXCW motif protein [Hyphomicrobium sp. 99]|uniref:PQQ-dependent catabolism-associated CXXCW motif protein n=1 Tax=Hyphomicrobium sp. 99 TaxID=1163419 RepID=UPI001FD96A1B|nr:PQQ-dependent catabolism-associated CXXCW motif protein [Hyphomicrobium sp. 99]
MFAAFPEFEPLESAAPKMLLSRLCMIAVLSVSAAFWVPIAGSVSVSAEEDVSGPAPSGEPPAEPHSYRTDNYRKPVPLTLEGAAVLSDEEAMKVWAAKSAIFIDVYPRPPKPDGLPAGTIWRDPSHMTIEDAVWLPNVGYGVLSAEASQYFQRNLEMLTNGDKAKPLVFFCLKNCWMSWNAAKRALSFGYKNVSWYRDGSDGWQEAGGLVVEAHPLP